MERVKLEIVAPVYRNSTLLANMEDFIVWNYNYDVQCTLWDFQWARWQFLLQ